MPAMGAVMPAIGQLAAYVKADDSHMRALNNVLLDTRSERSPVRLAGLFVIEHLWDRLSDSMLYLLPETLPFLAELVVQVARKVAEVVQLIRSITGEDVDKYVA